MQIGIGLQFLRPPKSASPVNNCLLYYSVLFFPLTYYLYTRIFFSTGSVWVYPNYGKRFADDFVPCTGNMTTGCTKDCDETLMKFSFGMVTLDWIFMGFWVILIGCMACRACGRGGRVSTYRGRSEHIYIWSTIKINIFIL